MGSSSASNASKKQSEVKLICECAWQKQIEDKANAEVKPTCESAAQEQIEDKAPVCEHASQKQVEDKAAEVVEKRNCEDASPKQIEDMKAKFQRKYGLGKESASTIEDVDGTKWKVTEAYGFENCEGDTAKLPPVPDCKGLVSAVWDGCGHVPEAAGDAPQPRGRREAHLRIRVAARWHRGRWHADRLGRQRMG